MKHHERQLRPFGWDGVWAVHCPVAAPNNVRWQILWLHLCIVWGGDKMLSISFTVSGVDCSFYIKTRNIVKAILHIITSVTYAETCSCTTILLHLISAGYIAFHSSHYNELHKFSRWLFIMCCISMCFLGWFITIIRVGAFSNLKHFHIQKCSK